MEVTTGMLKGEDKFYVRIGAQWPRGHKDRSMRASLAPVTALGHVPDSIRALEAVTCEDLDSSKDNSKSLQEAHELLLDGATYSLVVVMDGHNGYEAAQFCCKIIEREIHARLPEGAWPQHDSIAGQQWLAQIRGALACSISACERKFSAAGLMAGTTVTLVLITGWLVTAANIGDSAAFVDTGKRIVPLTEDHRLDFSPQSELERMRTYEPKYKIRRLDVHMGGPAEEFELGVGPLRIWPGGIAVSRGIGDFSVGSIVLSAPRIVQMRVPEGGARLVIASDGLWDADKTSQFETRVIKKVRRLDTLNAARKLLYAAGKGHGLTDDTTVVVVDLMPSVGDLAVPGFMGGTKAIPKNVKSMSNYVMDRTGGKQWEEEQRDMRGMGGRESTPAETKKKKGFFASLFGAGSKEKKTANTTIISKNDWPPRTQPDVPTSMLAPAFAEGRSGSLPGGSGSAGKQARAPAGSVRLANGLVIPSGIDVGHLVMLGRGDDDNDDVEEEDEVRRAGRSRGRRAAHRARGDSVASGHAHGDGNDDGDGDGVSGAEHSEPGSSVKEREGGSSKTSRVTREGLPVSSVRSPHASTIVEMKRIEDRKREEDQYAAEKKDAAQRIAELATNISAEEEMGSSELVLICSVDYAEVWRDFVGGGGGGGYRRGSPLDLRPALHDVAHADRSRDGPRAV